MDTGKTKNNEGKKVSKRTFLKTLTGTAAGVAVALTLPTITKAENAVENINDRFLLNNGITYIDSAGRRVVVAQNVQRVIPAGIFAQTILEMLCPEKLCSVAKSVETSERSIYFDSGKTNICRLEESGALYADGSCENVSEIDTEQISRKNADLILDIGSHKNKQAAELSSLQQDAEIPTLFIDAEVGNLSSAVRFLGELLNCSNRAIQMADFIDEINADIQTRKVDIEQKPKVLYDSTDSDFYKNQEYSFQNEIIKTLGFDVAELMPNHPEKTNADIVIFSRWSRHKNIIEKRDEDYEMWNEVEAIKNGAFAVAPGLFHSWAGSPVLVQIIGALWIGKTVMPDIYDFDIKEYAKEFYRLFYNYALTDTEISGLLGTSKRERDNLHQEEKQLIEIIEQMDEIKMLTSDIADGK